MTKGVASDYEHPVLALQSRHALRFDDMKPLDLSKHPPRSPRVMLAGLLMMGRTVDKARALLPGGNPGQYYVTPGISAWILKRLGLSEAEFIDVVAAADDDAAVEAYIAPRVTDERRQKINDFVSRFTILDVGDEMRALFERHHPGFAEETTPIIELLERDDVRRFPTVRSME